VDAFLTWLVEGGVGPAGIGLPVTWAASELASASRRWFQRLRRSDDLSRIVRAATDGDVDLTRAEFAAVRDLLGQESTWTTLGRGTVEDLANRIAECLQGRAEDESLQAGRAIAAGLLEFTAGDLEPEWFQKVFFARLARLETNQASALDRALTSLAVLLDCREADNRRLGHIPGQLDLILDRIQPGSADRREVMVYLAALIRRLNSDPWTQGSRETHPALAPADIERKLRVDDSGGSGDLDADQLGKGCSRLVVLGGPGSGKTWLAKRTARLCAEAALARLLDGAEPDEVELPLYTTCAALAEQKNGGIRHAVVESALSHMPDLGGTRTEAAIRKLFGERNTAATLLVLDSLDEARNADRRVINADSLPGAWRIMLTSRPGSWKKQLTIRDHDPRTHKGNLLPLSYPDDIKAFVQAWFYDEPGWAEALTAQIGDRRDLQETVTVPLLLTFCCIIGKGQLPRRRVDLYEEVVKHMLAGRWRGSYPEPEYDLNTCMDTLCEWAWSAAASDPVSGVGDWKDEFSTPRVADQGNREALGHVAVPQDQADIETRTRRRFVHRSVHEHLVARRVSRMPAPESASVLLDHVWYDPDWEYAAAAALAMHPERDEVLRKIISQIAEGCGQSAAGPATMDGCWEIRRFLAKVARESSEKDWEPDTQAIIAKARQELAVLQCASPSQLSQWENNLSLVPANGWSASNRPIIESVLRLLPNWPGPWCSRELAEVISKGDPTAEQRAQTQEVLHDLLACESDHRTFQRLVKAVAEFAVTAQERTQARQALVSVTANRTEFGQFLLPMETFAGMDPPAEERAQAREAVIRMLAGETELFRFRMLMKVFSKLGPPVEEQARAWEMLVGALTRQALPWGVRELTGVLSGLGPPAEERAKAWEALVSLLTHEAHPGNCHNLAVAVAGITVTAQERERAMNTLLGLLSRITNFQVTPNLAVVLAGLAVTAQEQAQAREVLLSLLARETDIGYGETMMAEALSKLGPPAEERAQARAVLLRRLTRETHLWEPRREGKVLAGLAVTAQERAQAREALLGLINHTIYSGHAQDLTEVLVELGPSPEERAQAREVLLRLFIRAGDIGGAEDLRVFAQLGPPAEERARAREVLLRLLIREAHPLLARDLVVMYVMLGPSAEERTRVLKILPGLLADETDNWWSPTLVKAAAELAVTEQEQTQTRETLLSLLMHETKPKVAYKLAAAVAQLRPAVADLCEPDTWSCGPTHALLAAVRHNSRRAAWIAILPQLPEPTCIPDPRSGR
jgi:hypothetical protein